MNFTPKYFLGTVQATVPAPITRGCPTLSMLNRNVTEAPRRGVTGLSILQPPYEMSYSFPTPSASPENDTATGSKQVAKRSCLRGSIVTYSDKNNLIGPYFESALNEDESRKHHLRKPGRKYYDRPNL